MKRIIISLSAVLLLISCGENKYKPETYQTKLNILCTFYPVFIMTKNITRDINDVEVQCLTPLSTGCLHDYSLTVSDAKKISEADIIIANGLGMESFYDRMIKENVKAKIINASEPLDTELYQIYHQRFASYELNPHLWVSITGAINQVENIKNKLIEYDPVRKDLYIVKADEYISKLKSLKEEMHSKLNGMSKKPIITFHEAFPWFAAEFSLDILGIIEAEPGIEPSPKVLQNLINKIKREGSAILFIEPQYHPGAAEVIVHETGSKVFVLDPAVTGPEELDAYLTIMRQNLDVLAEAFK